MSEKKKKNGKIEYPSSHLLRGVVLELSVFVQEAAVGNLKEGVGQPTQDENDHNSKHHLHHTFLEVCHDWVF